uniref:Uncharacterized protein n=1 Tax=Physcomitrium patens TaxID=3218 RepID=A0A2K1JU01_PHYPA|nr:hypothetical protein PHYPA_014778 [Physcomitrium patens]
MPLEGGWRRIMAQCVQPWDYYSYSPGSGRAGPIGIRRGRTQLCTTIRPTMAWATARAAHALSAAPRRRLSVVSRLHVPISSPPRASSALRAYDIFLGRVDCIRARLR